MTTNVYDIGTGMLASDSRWSKDVNNFLFFVDDVDYEKIVFDSQMALLFAGHMGVIQAWKNWFYGGRHAPLPDVHPEFSVCVVDMSNGAVRKDHGLKLFSPNGIARFAGTGSPHALNCWEKNKDAVKSIETAIAFDLKTGGKVSYLSRKNRANNLCNNSTVDHVLKELKRKGMMIMLNKNKGPVSIQETIETDLAAKAAFETINTGGASLCAPFMGMGVPWSNEDKEDLYRILSEYPPEQRSPSSK